MTDQLDGKINDIPGIAEGIASVDNTLEEIIQYTKKSEAILTGPRDDIDLEESTHIIISIRGLANSKNEDGNINIEFLSQEVVRNALNVSFQLEKIIKNLGNKWKEKTTISEKEIDNKTKLMFLEDGIVALKHGFLVNNLNLNGETKLSFHAEYYVLEAADERYEEMARTISQSTRPYGKGPKAQKRNYYKQQKMIRTIVNEYNNSDDNSFLIINVSEDSNFNDMTIDDIKTILIGPRPKMNSYGNGENRNPRGN